MDKAAPDPLQVIRARIDAIDEAMHRLLIERSGVIAELIDIKGLSKPGGAFRPGREADMMRRIVMRHEGALPIVSVEHIWREIITTFTAMQAPFGIAAGPAADPLALRDATRFYFGFSVPVTLCETAAAAVARVAASARDIAIVAIEGEERWWDALDGAAAPRIFARLPFIEITGHPAVVPAYVIGPPLKDSAVPDMRVLAVKDEPGLDTALLSHGGSLVARAGDDLIVELPVAATAADLGRELGRPLAGSRDLGGFFQPIRYLAPRTA